jgi:hypothetical protein
MEKEKKYSLKAMFLGFYKKFQNAYENYLLNIKKNESLKKAANEEYKKSLKETDKLKEDQKKIIQEKEDLQKEINEGKNIVNEIIEEVRLKCELKELKEKNKLEKEEFKFIKDIEKKNLENNGKVERGQKEAEMYMNEKTKENEIRRMELKYKCLKDQIYDDKEFDELIEIVTKRKDEILNDEIESFIEQKNELEKLKKNSEKRIEYEKEKKDCEIQKKFIELQKYKYTEYNKYLLEKEKMFNEFKNKFSVNQLSNNNLKNKEIEKAKIYFEQQKNIINLREDIFKRQQQNINAFIKQLEINDDDYSKYLLSLLK